jgi:Holliday junction resolvasome RuvABC endonuclease subunit
MIAGFDCSSKAIHLSLLDKDENLVGLEKFESKDKNYEIRFYEILDKFEAYAGIIDISTAAIESAIYIQNAKATIAIASVVAGIKLQLHRSGTPFASVDNRKWKKVIIGKGNASKSEIMDFSISQWGDLFPEQDYADAACIALWRKRDGR